MRIILGILIGLVLAAAIAAGAAYYAFGPLLDVSERDRSEDITEQFEVADFDGVEIGGIFDFEITTGGDFAVTISGPENAFRELEVGVEGGTLSVDQSSIEINGKRRWRDAGMTVEVTLPELRRLDVSGVADGRVTGIDSDYFLVDASGISDITLSGRCRKLEAQLSGLGDLDAQGLRCENADVAVSGLGEAKIFASESADAAVYGLGSVEIYGDPKRVEKQTSFLSDISIQ
ncbi:head GIN domain-containing protein [Hyphococcus sp. DH-69]|uniref:head GIN domain-containing protein n=1 Tax=Hyphococcus formosus TaxID=3143534 RepID=UPI00398A6AC9